MISPLAGLRTPGIGLTILSADGLPFCGLRCSSNQSAMMAVSFSKSGQPCCGPFLDDQFGLDARRLELLENELGLLDRDQIDPRRRG